MPRGNDSEAAARELEEKYQTSGNAEAIIKAQQARFDPVLRAANMTPIDEEATENFSGAKAGKAVNVKTEQVQSFAVRGKYLVVVYEDEDGVARKSAKIIDGEDTRDPTPQEEAFEAERRSDIHQRAEATENARIEAEERAERDKAEADQAVKEAKAAAKDADDAAKADEKADKNS